MFCPNCGKEIGDSKFCPECGVATNQITGETVSQQNYTPQNINVTVTKQKKPITKRWWFWVLIGLFVLGSLPNRSNSSKTSSTSSKTSNSSVAASTQREQSTNKEDPPKATSIPKKYSVIYEITDIVYSIEDSSFGSGKRYYAVIEITNTGEMPIYLDKCVLDFEDNNGHLLQTDSILSSVPDIVQPGEKGYFYTNGSNAFDEDVSFENGCNPVPTVYIEKANGTLKSHEVTDISLYESYNTVGCKGRIINETDKDISLIYVTIVFYDRNGKVLGISGTNVTDIKANSKTSFDSSGLLMKEFSTKDVADYRVFADETYYQF